jgi:hypothetical protein
LSLVQQYLPGYRVTAQGSLLGFAYGGVLGLGAGYFLAGTINASHSIYLALMQDRGRRQRLKALLDELI